MTDKAPSKADLVAAAEGAGQQRQQKRPLDHGESRTCADAGTGRERQIGFALRFPPGLGLPAGGAEDIRRIPVPFVAVQVPGRQHHLRAGRDRPHPATAG